MWLIKWKTDDQISKITVDEPKMDKVGNWLGHDARTKFDVMANL